MSERRDLYEINGELYHGIPGGTDMRPILSTDIDTAYATVTTDISTASSAAQSGATAAAYENTTVTATDDGLTTAIITSSARDLFVVVTSANADHIVTLPAPTPGRRVTLVNAATGYEIRSSAPTTVLINNGTGGAEVESAVGANVMVVLVCRTALAWTANTYALDGTEAKLEAAA